MPTEGSSPESVSVDLSGVINLPAASENTDGIVQLADVLETQQGLEDDLAITPAGAAATYIPISAFTEKGDLLTATAAGKEVAISVGGDGQVLMACSESSTGLQWSSLPPAAIPCSCVTGKGAIIAGLDQGIPTALAVGGNGQVLIACSSAPSGLCWGPMQTATIPCSCIIGKGSLISGSDVSSPVALPVGSNGQVLRANSACTAGLEWTSIGKTSSVVENAGVIALTMDNLRVCFTSTGNRTWAFSTVCGTETATVQTTSANCALLSTQRRVATLTSTAFTELGWNFACSAACATYLICLGTATVPTAIYCFVGMVGCNYNNNMFNLTRLY
jgi:hypothetical protein